jgi:hypothetical protein
MNNNRNQLWIDAEIDRQHARSPFPAFRVVVAGSRGFGDYDLMRRKLNTFLERRFHDILPVEIVSGTADGADRLGETYARERNLAVIRIPAPWDALGRSAGHARNEVMARFADAVVVFWDGESRGSQGMIRLAQRLDVPHRIVRY